MPLSSSQIKVYLKVDKKRTFAGAIEWPGWDSGHRSMSRPSP